MKKKIAIFIVCYACIVTPALAQVEVLFELAGELLTNLFNNQDQIKQGDGFTDDAPVTQTPNAQKENRKETDKELDQQSSSNPFLRKQPQGN